MKITVLLIAIAFSLSPLFGQNIKFDRLGSQLGEGIGDVAIGITKDDVIYAFGYKGRLGANTVYKCVDGVTGKIINEFDYKTQIKEMGIEAIQCYMIFENNDPLLIAEELKGKTTTFYAYTLDKEGNINSDAIKLVEGEKCDREKLFTSKRNKTADVDWIQDTITHKNFFVSLNGCEKSTISKHREITMSVAVFDKNFKKVTDFIATLPEPIMEYSDIKVINDDLYITASRMTEEAAKRNIKGSAKKLVFKIDLSGNIETISLPELYEKDGIRDIKLVTENGEIKLLGVLHRKWVPTKTKKKSAPSENSVFESAGVIGVWKATFDSEKNQIKDEKVMYFSRDFLTQFSTKKERKAFKETDDLAFASPEESNYTLIEHFATDDGGNLSLYQNQFMFESVSVSETGTTSTTTYFVYADVLVLKSTKEGDFEWVRNLPLIYRMRTTDPGTTVSALFKNDKLYVMHTSNDVLGRKIETQSNPDDKGGEHSLRIKEIAVSTVDMDGNISYDNTIPLKGKQYVMKHVIPNRYITNGRDAFFYINKGKRGKEFELFRVRVGY